MNPAAERRPALPAWDISQSRDSQPQMVGIGLTFKRDKEKGYVVKRVVPGGPSYLDGGVQPGDTFLEVDGVSVRGKTPEELTRLVLGPVGSSVSLMVSRGGGRFVCA
uniref:PDZ domain-containing protein n=1 Tax=Hemiselmis tepida TaxID=464990 RepID=A0A7S0VDF8_9CRYP|mmetsp:Transcript_1660/g.4179  ORF Transcript_1660/g.4179 Transcript_1660/m.4179 type:complete len:107 (+) Transcript_1660:26-346(+)